MAASDTEKKQRNIHFAEHGEFHAANAEIEFSAIQGCLSKLNFEDKILIGTVEDAYKLAEILKEQSVGLMLLMNQIKHSIK